MNSNFNAESKSKYNEQNNIQIKLNKDTNTQQNKEGEKDILMLSPNSKENQNYLNELNNKDESIIKKNEEDNLIISFSNISELNKTNFFKDNKLNSNEKKIIIDNSNINNNFQFTPVNNDKNYINNTYNNDIKTKNLNYIFNILNSDNKYNSKNENNIIQEKISKSKDNSLFSKKLNDNSNFNFSSLNDFSSIQYKNSNKKENNNKNYIIENIKNINIINSNEKSNEKDKIKYEINNVNNIAIINNKNQKNENINQLSDINNTKHCSNFSFGLNNFNIITNNGKHNYGNNHINYDENKMDNIIENNDEYFSPKFNIQNGLNEFKNINEIKKPKKKQFEISHIDEKDIINIKGNKSKDSNINIGYTDLQIKEGFPPFSIIDKKNKGTFKKININKIKLSKAKKLSLNKSKTKINKNNSKGKNIFPNEEELYINSTTNENKNKKYIKEKEKSKYKNNNITLEIGNNPKRHVSTKIKNINIFNENKNTSKMIDQNLKEKIQNILKKNFELILSNNNLLNITDKRHSFMGNSTHKNRNSSNCSFNSNYSNASYTIKEQKINNRVRNNKKVGSTCLYKGNYNYKKLNSKNIFANNTFNKENRNNNSFSKNKHKKIILKKEVSPRKKENLIFQKYVEDNKRLRNKKPNIKKNETNIIKFIKRKAGISTKEEKTYIIENKDINIFNIDINKNDNSMIYCNIDNFNNCSNNKIIGKNSIDKEDNGGTMNNTLQKYKKPIAVINNFKYYKRKNIDY